MQGWIKDHRRELDSDIWMMPPLYHRVWQYLKYKANHKENKIPMRDGSFLNIKPGQHLTSVRNIANGVSWYERGISKTPNPKTIDNILIWLEMNSMIHIDKGKGNRQYTLITLLNWDSFQEVEGKGNSKVTVNKQLADINKNEKNEKNEKEYIPYSEIVKHLNEKTGKKFRSTTKKTMSLIDARWNEGNRLEDFQKVIDVCAEKWSGQIFSNGNKGDDYLQPSTLFNDKFEERLNWTSKQQPRQRDHRDKEIEFQKWMAADNKAEDFDWETGTGKVDLS